MKNINQTAQNLMLMLERGETTSEMLVSELFHHIAEHEPKVEAYMSLLEEEALAQARQSDLVREQGKKVGALEGIPIAIKDAICVKGAPTTCSSRFLENYLSPYDATVIEKLREAGAIIIGKTNMDEFAMGSSTENSYYKKTKNPWDLTRIPGGSSGGSAAAVAASQATMALGSDTGGSIRQPASLCGVVGMKPTYGRVSRYGLVAFASSLDQIGPLTRDVTDCAMLLNVICGHDERDSTSLNVDIPDFTASLIEDVKGLKVGRPKEFLELGIDPQVKAAVEKATADLEQMGAQIVDISLPHTEHAVATYYILAPAEASANLARFDGVRYGFREKTDSLLDLYEISRDHGFGPEVKRRIMLGTYVLSSGYYDAYYLKAQKVRSLIKQDYVAAFREVDVIIGPTSPTPAFKIGEKAADPLQMYMCDIFTLPTNLSGYPGISVPCGYTQDNLPIGLQFIGKALDEATLIRTAYTFEQGGSYKRRSLPFES